MAGMLNIFDMEQFTREFMKKCIAETNQEVDTSDDSAFNDVFIEPLMPIVKKLIETISSVEFKSNLAYASLMSEADLDLLGENNYFIDRTKGDYSKGVETFIFNNVSDDTKIIIPAGVMLTDNDETVNFITTQRVVINSNELSSYYDSETMDYRVPVPITAAYPGSGYNKAAGSITKCLTSVSSLLTGVTNLTATSGGTDRETNEEYANRMKTFYSSQHLGQDNGYVRDIKDSSPAITDVKVVGKGDAEMTRDRIYVLDDSAVSELSEDGYFKINTDAFVYDELSNSLKISGDFLKRVGYGGKVDIYIKGSDYSAVTDTIEAQTPVYDLNIEIADIPYISKINEYTIKFALTVSDSGQGLTYYAPRDFSVSENPPDVFLTTKRITAGNAYTPYSLVKTTARTASYHEGKCPDDISISSEEVESRGRAIKTIIPGNVSSLQEQLCIGLDLTGTGTAAITFILQDVNTLETQEANFTASFENNGIKLFNGDSASETAQIYTVDGSSIYLQADRRSDAGAILYASSDGLSYTNLTSFTVNKKTLLGVQIIYLNSSEAETGTVEIAGFYALKSANERDYRTYNLGVFEQFEDKATYTSSLNSGNIAKTNAANNIAVFDSDFKDRVRLDIQKRKSAQDAAFTYTIESGYTKVTEQPNSWETVYSEYYKKLNDDTYTPYTSRSAFKSASGEYSSTATYYIKDSVGNFTVVQNTSELAFNNGLYYVSAFDADNAYLNPGLGSDFKNGKASLEFVLNYNNTTGKDAFVREDGDSIGTKISLFGKSSEAAAEQEVFNFNINMVRSSSGSDVSAAEGLGLSGVIEALNTGVDECKAYLDSIGVPSAGIDPSSSSYAKNIKQRVRAASMSLCTDTLGNLVRPDVYDILMNFFGWDLSMIEYKSISELKNMLYSTVYSEVSTYIEYMNRSALISYSKKISLKLYKQIESTDTDARIRTKIRDYLKYITIKTGPYIRVSKSKSIYYDADISGTNQELVGYCETLTSYPLYVKILLDFSSGMYCIYTKIDQNADYESIGSVVPFTVPAYSISSIKGNYSLYLTSDPETEQNLSDCAIELSDFAIKYYEQESVASSKIKEYAKDPFADDMPKIADGFTVVHRDKSSNRAVIIIKDSTYASEYTLNYQYDDGSGVMQSSKLVIPGRSQPLKNSLGEEFYKYGIISPASDIYLLTHENENGEDETIDIDYVIDGVTYEMAKIIHESNEGEELSPTGSIEYNSSLEYSKLEMPQKCAFKVCHSDDYTNAYKAMPYVNSEALTVSYSANSVLAAAAEKYKNNRLVTADVLIREAGRTYVNIEMRVSTGTVLTTTQKSEIISAVKSFIDAQAIEGSIQQSDLINYLYEDYRTQQYVDYIELPLKAFYVSEAAEDEIDSSKSVENILTAFPNTYLYIGKCIISRAEEGE